MTYDEILAEAKRLRDGRDERGNSMEFLAYYTAIQDFIKRIVREGEEKEETRTSRALGDELCRVLLREATLLNQRSKLIAAGDEMDLLLDEWNTKEAQAARTIWHAAKKAIEEAK